MSIYAVVNRKVKITDPTPIIQLREPLSTTEGLAHYFGVIITNDDGTDFDLTNINVSGKCIRGDNATIPLTGEKTGNKAYLILPKACYAYKGRFTVTLFLTESSGTNAPARAILKVKGTIDPDSTSTIVDPDHIVPDLDALLAEIDTMEDAITRANAAIDLIEDITVAAHAVSGETPTVTKTTVDDHYNFDFGLVPARQTSVDTAYAQTTSGTTVPSSWSPNRPTTVPGQYLWTRLTRHWNNSADTVEYTVAYQGLNGTGSVNSVQGVSPDSNGNVTLPTDATPTTGSTNFMTSGAIKTAIDAPHTLTVDFGTISSLPTTKTVTGMTSDMVAIAHNIGTPTAFESEITVTTADGSATLSGTMAESASSTVVITFAKTTTVTGA